MFLKFGYPPQITLLISILLSFLSILARIRLIKIQIIQLSIKELISEVALKSIVVTIVSAIMPILLHYYSNTRGLYGHLLVILISFISTVLAVWFIGMTKSERDFLLQMIKIKSINKINKK